MSMRDECDTTICADKQIAGFNQVHQKWQIVVENTFNWSSDDYGDNENHADHKQNIKKQKQKTSAISNVIALSTVEFTIRSTCCC